jgi:copper chaperone CopZ
LKENPMQTIDLDVQGMTCSGCVKHVSKALQAVPGVDDVAVDLATGHVKVTASATVINAAWIASLITALKEEDYVALESLKT